MGLGVKGYEGMRVLEVKGCEDARFVGSGAAANGGLWAGVVCFCLGF